MWAQHKLACDQSELRAAEYTTFCTLWRKLLPTITVMKPMSDLCWVCQQHSTALMRAANSPLEAKSDVSNSTYTCYVTWLTQVVKRAQDHLELATKARSYYRAQIAASKEGLNAIFGSSSPAFGLRPRTNELSLHLSFDMALQVNQMNVCVCVCVCVFVCM